MENNRLGPRLEFLVGTRLDWAGNLRRSGRRLGFRQSGEETPKRRQQPRPRKVAGDRQYGVVCRKHPGK